MVVRHVDPVPDVLGEVRGINILHVSLEYCPGPLVLYQLDAVWICVGVEMSGDRKSVLFEGEACGCDSTEEFEQDRGVV